MLSKISILVQKSKLKDTADGLRQIHSNTFTRKQARKHASHQVDNTEFLQAYFVVLRVNKEI